jgi:hypothetical protein
MLVDLDNYQMTWLEGDTGNMVKCLCYFDLSVTIGPLDPGTYSVDVYHTERWEQDTLYDGSTSFVIERNMNSGTAEVIKSFQSDCYDLVGTDDNPIIAPVGQNFPNPFSDRTTIPYKLMDQSASYLLIMNMLGEVVRALELKPDMLQTTWDGTDDNGRFLPSGMYYYGIPVSALGKFRKIVILR